MPLTTHHACPSRAYPAFDVVAIAASTGGLTALRRVLSGLPREFPAAIVVVQHLPARGPSVLVELLQPATPLSVAWARQGGALRPGTVSVAPPDRHLRVTADGTLALSDEPRGRWVRPSADVLFTSVAVHYQARALGVVLTGALHDGARGARALQHGGGRVLAQDEATSACFSMPQAAIRTGSVDFVLPLGRIAPALIALVMVPGAAALFRVAHRVRRAAEDP